MKKFKTLVYIGRFQPFHNAHLKTIEIASELSDQLIVIIGSDNSPRTIKNPFTTQERTNMILASIKESEYICSKCEIIIDKCEDFVYDDEIWVSNIKTTVEKYVEHDNVGIIGHSKDDSSFYLELFSDWELHPIERLSDINATNLRNEFLDIRNIRVYQGLNYLNDTSNSFVKENVPTPVFEAITYFINGNNQRISTNHYETLYNEFIYIENQTDWTLDFLDYQPIFVTAHCFILHCNKILLNKRSHTYCNGKLELPGNYVDSSIDKNIKYSAIRALKDLLKLDSMVKFELFNNVEKIEVFDKIGRSQLGRHIAHVVHFKLENPAIQTLYAKNTLVWVDIENLDRKDFFEDHYDIIIKHINKR